MLRIEMTDGVNHFQTQAAFPGNKLKHLQVVCMRDECEQPDLQPAPSWVGQVLGTSSRGCALACSAPFQGTSTLCESLRKRWRHNAAESWQVVAICLDLLVPILPQL